ncbi:hypothetical protein KP509_33G060700 [Ceratopteris richardii]|uniref:Large ribosomal subunit protein bL20c n=1 Tax=Ceratopteris richardii TaxID=49495 RepID=A0A8T2QS17_CERRI|nr:hypothetical protein KP509_33G060700 [Ceratopteris richardii]
MKMRAKILQKIKKNCNFRSAHVRICLGEEQKALTRAYVDRKNKKRTLRRLWIARINEGAWRYGSTHSGLIHDFYKNRVLLNCKILPQVATLDAY